MPEAVYRLQNSELFTRDLKIRVVRHELSSHYPLHWHEFYEITLVLGGTGTSVVNGRGQRIARGHMILLTPSDFHEVIPDRSCALDLWNINFAQILAPEDLMAQIASLRSMPAVLFAEPDIADVQFRLKSLQREIASPSSGYQMAARNDLERILIEWHRRALPVAAVPDGSELELSAHPQVDRRMQRALTLIHRRFRKPLPLAEVAAAAGLSANYFSDAFRRRVGVTFQDYLSGLRLEFARQWLHGTTVPVTEISFLAGFGTLGHFDKLFRRRYGQSPTQYRAGVNDDGRRPAAPD